jgi:glycosyltransferase involved in cell wall biosynthesis
MNIALFLTQAFNPTQGGVQRSTSKLALIYKANGHKVVIVSLTNGENTSFNGIPVVYLGKEVRNRVSLVLKEVLKEHETQIILNQAGSSTRTTRLLKNAVSEKVKIVNTLRINPLNFVQNSSLLFRHYLKQRKIEFLYSRIWLVPLLAYHRIKQHLNHRYILWHADAYVMLSEGFLEELSYFGIDEKKYQDKLFAISNPFELPKNPHSWEEKENVILFVGRLNKTQKRVDLLMKIWKELHPRLTSWQFWVVGDGQERQWMEQYCKDHQMDRVHFFGYTDPTPYYRKAKLLHFTSAYEGFGNVLIEAQSYGVIPVLFNSYSAASEIINDKKDGLLITPFQIEEFTQSTVNLLSSENQLRRLSNAAVLNTNRYGYNRIGQKWESLFSKI